MTDNSFIFDLPTHLPNESPSIPPPKPSTDSVVEETIEDDDEEQRAKTSGPVVIQGTNITLQTEEDIAKWIEERKKNWPSKTNVDRKKRAIEEKEEENKSTEQQQPSKKRKINNVCQFYRLHKKCKFGNKCKNLHEDPVNVNAVTSSYNELTHYRKFINDIPVLIPKLYSNRTENTQVKKSSLFKHLVTRDQMVNENEQILEFIKYLEEKKLINHSVMKP
ncbi:hypothetical protein SBY92_000079 [Candida maltosa Xu316]